MNRFVWIACWLFFGFILATGVRSQVPVQTIQELPSFEYDSTFSLIKHDQINKTKSCRSGQTCQKVERYESVLESVNPTDGGAYWTKFFLYKSWAKGPRPLIFILPVIDGITPVEKGLAQYFSKKGYHAVIVDSPESVDDTSRPVSDIDGFLIRTTTSLRVLLDFFETQSYVDPSRIGAFGASFGGIRLFLLMGVDQRFDNGAIVVGGGGLPEILADSDVDTIINFKEAKMKEHGLKNRKGYLKLLNDNVLVEPLNYAHKIDPQGVMMLLSTKDNSVPSSNQMKAYQAIDPVFAEFLPFGHVVSVISSWFYRGKVLNFFESRWGLALTDTSTKIVLKVEGQLQVH